MLGIAKQLTNKNQSFAKGPMFQTKYNTRRDTE